MTFLLIYDRKILNAKAEVQLSGFYQNFLLILKETIDKKTLSEIVCLGLGRVASCKTAQHQLGLLLLLEEQFLCPVEVFDPIFSSIEKDILCQLKLKLVETNFEGKRKPSSSGYTLFIFPHCPKELSNNLLYFNWSPSQLEHCILYANSFEKIRLDTPQRFLKNYHYLLQSLEVVEELPVPNTFRFPDVFNDLSLHHFPVHLTNKVEHTFWESREVPVYPTESELVSGK